MMDLKGKKVWLTGHKGLVGSTLLKALKKEQVDLVLFEKPELDLRDQCAVEQTMAEIKPDLVIIAAAKVGGIEANRNNPTEFLYDNLMISSNLINAAANHNVGKLVNLGSSCFYPRLADQPIQESSLLTGPLEPTNEAYAIAKIAAAKLCQYHNRQYGRNYITVVPTNLYGPNDHFDIERGHVIPSLMRRFYDAVQSNAPSITLWGTGTPEREFLFVEDAAAAIIHLIKNYEKEDLINISGGETIRISELASLIGKLSGYQGEIIWDHSKPDGMPRKALSNEQIKSLDWVATTSFEKGLKATWDYFIQYEIKP